MSRKTPIQELPELRDRARVFRDRTAAGAALAVMLEGYRGGSSVVLGIPAGGVPVAAAISGSLGLALEVAPVSKVLLPWTTEAGYGAVAFDGTVWVNEGAVVRYDLTEDQVVQATAEARAKVERRMAILRGGRALPSLAQRTVIIVDDGIAAGSTLRTAIAAVRRHAPREIVVAVPTAHDHALRSIADVADAVYCANVRSGLMFAVADAYEEWRDLSDAEVARVLADSAPRGSAP